MSRRPVTPQTSIADNLPTWIDWAVFLIVLISGIGSIVFILQTGTLSASLLNDPRWSWHIVRGAGMTAYMLLAASTIWGVFLSTRVIKDWSPGPLSLLLHATTSWLAVVLAAAHAVLLLFDNFYTYSVTDLLVPFVGPYRPFAAGLGIIAFWIVLAVTISFSLRKLMSRKAWLWLHYTSYASFGLVTAHALLAGTDAAQPGMLIILGVFTILVLAMVVWRLLQNKHVRNLTQ